MTIEVYVELPADPAGVIRIARARKGVIEPVGISGFRGHAGIKAVAFAPALLVNCVRVPVAARSDAEARKAALFAIEDDLAQPVEDVLLILGAKRSGTTERDAYIVDRKLLESWRIQLEDIGLGHAPIIAERSLRTSVPAVWDFGDWVLMTRDDEAVAVDPGPGAEAVQGFMSAAGFDGVPVRKADALATLAQLHQARPGVELDGGRHRGRKGLKAWQTAAALTVAGLLIWTATLALETRGHQTAARQAEMQARQMFKAQFIDAPAPEDVHTEVRRILQQTTPAEGAEFRKLASSLFRAIAASETIQLVNLSYTATESALQADLRFANVADEAAFRSRLESVGLRVDTTDVSDTENGVQGRFVLRSVP